MTGFNAVIGSWKIMVICFPRIPCISFSDIFRMSFPFKRISPPFTTAGGTGRIPKIARAMVVFPAPVSPTSPRVSPFFMEKETSLTA